MAFSRTVTMRMPISSMAARCLSLCMAPPMQDALLQRVVSIIRSRWEHTRIIIRADSGFCRNDLMKWCEDKGLFYVFGLARNTRLVARIQKPLRRACLEHRRNGKAGTAIHHILLSYSKDLGSKPTGHRQAEWTEGKDNPRFVATNLRTKLYEPRALYEDLYCARGEMENRIKEQQLYLFADRSSCSLPKANRLRLWFSAVAYVLMSEPRRRGLCGTELEGRHFPDDPLEAVQDWGSGGGQHSP